jgi:hypothetical protein
MRGNGRLLLMLEYLRLLTAHVFHCNTASEGPQVSVGNQWKFFLQRFQKVPGYLQPSIGSVVAFWIEPATEHYSASTTRKKIQL